MPIENEDNGNIAPSISIIVSLLDQLN